MTELLGGIKLSFIKYLNSKSRTGETSSPLLDGDGLLTNRGMFNAFFAFVFNPDNGLWDPSCPELEDRESRNDKLPANTDLACNLLLQVETMGPDGIHPRVLRKLADVLMKSCPGFN